MTDNLDPTNIDLGGPPRKVPKVKREFVYCVTPLDVDKSQHPGVKTRYTIEKFSEDDPIKDLPLETYFVTLYNKDRVAHAELSVFCSCPGFAIQKYSKLQHKHVLMVNAYELTGAEEPLYYKLDAQNNISSWSPPK